MKVTQLLETPTDFSPFERNWQSAALKTILEHLKTLGEKAELLTDILSDAYADGPGNHPENVTSMMQPLMDQIDELSGLNLKWPLDAALRELKHGAEAWLGQIVAAALQVGDAGVKLIEKQVNIQHLARYIQNEQRVKLQLAIQRANRSAAEVDHDDTHDTFIFVGRPAFVERPEGSGNFKKSLEIERLIKVDTYDTKAHQTAQMLKLRARVQGEKSEAYVVKLPKGTIADPDQLDDDDIAIINKLKQELK